VGFIVAYFAKLENNIVTQVISVSNDVCGEPTLTFPDTDAAGRAYIANGLKFAGTWAQTSYNANLEIATQVSDTHFYPTQASTASLYRHRSSQ
jgi:hypothetical protein